MAEPLNEKGDWWMRALHFGWVLLIFILAGCGQFLSSGPHPSATPEDTDEDRAHSAQVRAIALYSQKNWRDCRDKSRIALVLWKTVGNHATELNQMRLLRAKAAYHAGDEDALQQLEKLQSENLLDAEAHGILQTLANLFPLKAGSHWTYSLKVHTSINAPDQSSQSEDEKRATEERIIEANQDGAVRMVRLTKWEKGKEEKESDLYRLKDGAPWLLTQAGKPLTQPLCYIKPNAPRGTTWNQGTVKIFEKLSAKMTACAAGVDDVSTAAGTFRKCMMVSGKGPLVGTLTVSKDEFEAQYASTVEETEWFAPGVGSVKQMFAATFFSANQGTMRIVVQRSLLPGYVVK